MQSISKLIQFQITIVHYYLFMSIEFVKLYNATAEEERHHYLTDVQESLSRPKKKIASHYLYDEEGSKHFSGMNATDVYYLNDCEKDILLNKGEEILKAFGKEKFNLIDLGAGDALKTKILLKKALNQGYNFNYIAIDISDDSNKVLAENLKEVTEGKLNMTIITGTFEEGSEWVAKNKEEKNVFMMFGNTMGNFENHETVEYCKWMGSVLKKGDQFLFGLDLKKDPTVIQDAYSYSLNKSVVEFLKNSLRRVNKELEGTFDEEKFYVHTYFDPYEGAEICCMISTEDQTAKVGEKEISFKTYESIEVLYSRKWSKKQISQLMEIADTKLIEEFTDKKKYFGHFLFEKQ